MSRHALLSALVLLVCGPGASSAGASDIGLAPASEFPLASIPTAVASENLNGDTTDDVVALLPDTGEVAVLLSNGDGTFQPAQSYFAGGSTTGLALARVDQNNSAYDVVTADSDADSVSVLFGAGDGTFSGPTTYGDVLVPNSVAVASIDAEGHRDIVVGADGGVTVLWSNHDFPFETQTTESTAGPARFVHAADLNGDTMTDIVAAVPSTQSVVVLWGNGTQTLATPQTYSVGGTPTDLMLADVNGDAKPDLVVMRPGDVAVLLNQGTGFGPPIAAATGGRPGGMVAGRILYVSLPDTSQLAVIPGRGDGSFDAPEIWPASPGIAALATAQLDHANGYDLVAANSGAASVSVMRDAHGHVTLDPLSGFTFGPVVIGTAVTHPVTILNDGTAMVRVVKLGTFDSGTNTHEDGPPKQFPLAADACSGAVVLPGQGCSLTVGFDTSALGSFHQSLEVFTQPGSSRTYPIAGQVVPVPKPPDTTPPTLTIKTKARQRALAKRTILITAACNEVCQLTADGKFVIGKKRTRLSLAMRRAFNAAPNQRAALKVVFSKRTAKTLRKALASKKKVVARIAVLANDGHNRTRKMVSVRVSG